MANSVRAAASVREPTNEQLEGFESLADVFSWASVKGNPNIEYTQAGALLFAIAGEEYTSMTAEEFASISPEDFESALGVWKFSQFDNIYEMGPVECNLDPNPLIKGRARAAHKAARIWQKLEFSTKSMNEYKAWIDESAFNSLKAAKAPATAAPAPPVRL